MEPSIWTEMTGLQGAYPQPSIYTVYIYIIVIQIYTEGDLKVLVLFTALNVQQEAVEIQQHRCRCFSEVFYTSNYFVIMTSSFFSVQQTCYVSSCCKNHNVLTKEVTHQR